MSKKNGNARLRTLIRKIVQEELHKTLKSNDPGSSESFDLDPRFSTGHYMTDRDPFPHLEPSGETKRQTGKHSGKKTTEEKPPQPPILSPYPGGIFGPPYPPPPGNPPSMPSGRSGTSRQEPFPPHPDFGMHPPQTDKRNEPNDD